MEKRLKKMNNLISYTFKSTPIRTIIFSIDNLKNITYFAVKRLKPLVSTYKPASDWLLFMPLWWECANILNKHTSLLTTVSNSRRLGLLGNLKQKVSKMTNQITTYNFNQNQIRTTQQDNQLWFCLSDCMASLEIKNKSTQIRLDDKGVCKTYIPTKSGSQNITFINEPNLYRLIFRSNKPQAQAFADWVYSEVLPSIRKTGGYGVSTFTDNKKAMTVLGGLVKRCCRASIKEYWLEALSGAPEKNEALQATFGQIIKECCASAIEEALKGMDKQTLRKLELGDYNGVVTAGGMPFGNWLVSAIIQ